MSGRKGKEMEDSDSSSESEESISKKLGINLARQENHDPEPSTSKRPRAELEEGEIFVPEQFGPKRQRNDSDEEEFISQEQEELEVDRALRDLLSQQDELERQDALLEQQQLQAIESQPQEVQVIVLEVPPEFLEMATVNAQEMLEYQRLQSQRRQMEQEDYVIMMDLPDKIIAKVFSFLEEKHLKNARLVCKKWEYISYSPSLIRNTFKLILSYKHLSDKINPRARYVNILLCLHQLYSYSMCEIEKCKLFWDSYGSNVTYLDVILPPYGAEHLRTVLLSCPSLQHINLVTSPAAYIIPYSFFEDIPFPELLTVKLKGSSYFTVPLLRHVLKSAPKLESIGMRCDDCRSSDTFDPLKNMFLRPISKVKDVYFKTSALEDYFVDRLTASLGRHLERLTILNAGALTPKSLQYIKERCPKLRHLSMKRSMWATKFELQHTLFNLKHLNSISMRATYINNIHIGALAVVKHISYLELSRCLNIKYIGITRIFTKPRYRLMVELRLAYLQLTDMILLKIGPLLPNLEILDMAYNFELSRFCVRPIIWYFKKLRCLTLTKSLEKERPYLWFFNGLKKLNHLVVDLVPFNEDPILHATYLPNLQLLVSSTFLMKEYYPTLKRSCPALQYYSIFPTFEVNTIRSAYAYREHQIMYWKCKSVFGTCSVMKTSTVTFET